MDDRLILLIFFVVISPLIAHTFEMLRTFGRVYKFKRDQKNYTELISALNVLVEHVNSLPDVTRAEFMAKSLIDQAKKNHPKNKLLQQARSKVMKELGKKKETLLREL